MHLRVRRLTLIASAAALLAAPFAVSAPAASATSGPPAPTANPYSPAYGHPYRHGAVPTVAQEQKMKAYDAAHAGSTAASSNTNTLSYGGGGSDGIGVTSGTPKVYLVFWGSQWGTQGTDSNGDMTFSGDYDSGAPYIQELFKGIGTANETWSGVMTQYCDGPLVKQNATSCPAGAAQVGYPSGGVLAGVWYDNSIAEPSQADGTQIAQEAVSAAAHFGNATATSNRYTQYLILSAPKTNPDDYNPAPGDPSTGYCAWHDFTTDSALTGGGVSTPSYAIAFANIPYLMDVGSTCGQGAVNSPGTLDGYSIVPGHEYAETLSDQEPPDGWTSSTGSENADECAWIGGSGPGAMANVTFATGSFAMQSTWSNDTNQCAISHTVLPYALATSSGDQQSAIVGSTYASPLKVHLTDSLGTALSGASVTFTAPSSGATVTFASPCSGTKCTVTTDSNGYATSPAITAASAAGALTVTTSAYGASNPPTFGLDNLQGPPKIASAVSGGAQQATVTTSYSKPLVVKVTDSVGDPSAGVQVKFSAPATGPSVTFGSCTGGNPQAYECVVTTNSQGLATSSVATAGSVSGSFTVSATSSVGSPSFALTNLAGTPGSMSYVSGSSQQELAAGAFPAPLEVHVLDAQGNAVPGASVTFSAPASGATATFGACALGNPSANQCVVSTDANGDAVSSALIAGASPGSFAVQASVGGAPPVQFPETIGQSGYWTVASDGGIFNFGGAPFDGSLGNIVLNKPIVGMAAAPGGGYYLVASDGGVFTIGGAPFYGSAGNIQLNAPVVGMAVTSAGGYYLVASDGGIFNFGPGAPYDGSMGGKHLNAPIVGMAVAPGGGYYLVASDGGIFAFGGAPFYGSTGGMRLNQPVVGMAVTPGGGYYLVASDGGIFTFGGVPFYGSTGGIHLNKPIVGMALDPATGGYWLDASDGGIFNFNAPFYGSMGGAVLNQPMVGMAPSASLVG